MADGTVLDPGTGGDTIATDDLGATGKVQWVKLRDGTDGGSQTIASGNGTNTAALRVTVASDSTGTVAVTDGGGSLTVDGTVGVSGTVTVDSELTTADLDTGAGTDTRAVVGLVLAKSGGAANVSSSDPLPISDAGGSLTVDGTVSITANSTVNLAQVAGTTTDTNSGNKSAGTQRVVLATDQPQLTNALKVDGSAVTQPISAASAIPVSDNSGSLTVDAPVGTPVFTTVTPSTTGGWSKVKYAAQTTTKQAVKASAGTFGGYYVYNPNATVAYVQVFDVASGSVTLGTTAPDMIFGIPPTSAANLEITNGVNMGTAITLACTTTATGSTAPGTGLDLTIFYK